LFAIGNPGKALTNVNQAVTLAPNYADAVTLQASLNIRQGDNGAAIPSLKRVIQQHPTCSRPDSFWRTPIVIKTIWSMRSQPINKSSNHFRESRKCRISQELYILGKKNMPKLAKRLKRAVTLAPTYILAVERLVYLDVLEKTSRRCAKASGNIGRQVPKVS